LGAGWLLGVRLVETGKADDAESGRDGPRTTLAATVLMSLGGVLGSAAAILIALLVEWYSR
jgi:hypothetical protein